MPAGGVDRAARSTSRCHGDLTLHGVTKTVDIPAKAQLNGSVIQRGLGSLYASRSPDYDINAPNIGGVRRRSQDNGALECRVPAPGFGLG